MALAFDGSSSKLIWSGQIASAHPFSMFCWVKPSSATASSMVCGTGKNGGVNELMLYADGAGTGKMRAFVKSDGSVAASSTDSLSTGWLPALAVFTSGSSRTIYYGDGAAVTDTDAADAFSVAHDRFVVGLRGISDSLNFAGSIGHVACWAAALNAADWAALKSGVMPGAVRGASLIEYWPLTTQAATQTGAKGRVLTATSTSQAGDEPPVTMGSSTTVALTDAGDACGVTAILPRLDYDLAPDGCWTWFTDPRAVYANGATYVGWVDSTGATGISKYVHGVGVSNFTLHSGYGSTDEHDTPAVLIRSDGRIVAFYSHHNETVWRYRISTNPHDISAWGAEQTVSQPNATSYSNPFELSAVAGKVWHFFRDGSGGSASGISFRTTTDWSAWSSQTDVWRNGAVTPYHKMVSDGVSRIHFAATDKHPTEGQSSLYHWYMELDGSGNPHWYKSDGTEITASLPFGPSAATQIYDGSSVRCWVWDIAIDAAGHPRVVGTRFPGNDGTDHRYLFCRWNGSAWLQTEIASGGGWLYSAEPFYSGGICFDAANPNIVYLSKQFGSYWEIEAWRTSDSGATWALYRKLTSAAVEKNCRPISPKSHDGRAAVLFWSGTYSSFSTFDTTIQAAPSAPWDMPIAGTQSGAGAQSGDIVTAIQGAGVQIGMGNQSGALTTAITLAGTVSGVGTANGDILTRIELGGQQLATALQTLSLQSGISVAGIVSGAGTQSGDLTLTLTVGGQQLADSLTQGGIATSIIVAGQQIGASAQSGGLAGDAAQIAGSQSGQGAQSLVLSTSLTLTGQQIADAILTGNLTTEIRIGAVQHGVGVVFGSADTVISVAGTVGGAGAQAGGIVTGQALVLLPTFRAFEVLAPLRVLEVIA